MCVDKVIILLFWPHATNMLVTLRPSVLHHSATWYSLFQRRFSSALPPGSLPAFEIASKTFCLGLCQDTSLSLTAITCQSHPAKTPLNEASSRRCIHVFSCLSIKLRHSAANPSSGWHGGLGGSQRSRVGRSKVAEQLRVSQVDLSCPAMSHRLHHFEFPTPSHFLRASYMRVKLYSNLLCKWLYSVVKTILYSLVDAAPSLTGRKKVFFQSDCSVKTDGP